MIKLKCNLCGESFDAGFFVASIFDSGVLLVQCPNGCNLIEKNLTDMSADIIKEKE